MDPRSALERCAGDPDEFLAGTFSVSPQHRRAADPGRFDDLLSLAVVDHQISTGGLRSPAVRLVRDGEVIDRSEWTRPARTGQVRIDDLVHPGRLLEQFADGATVVLQSLHRWWEPLTRFCLDLQGDLGHAVQANAYLTPAGAAGLTPHHDTHDVFVLQVHGTKHWTVREPLVDSPLPRHRSDHEEAAAQPHLFDVAMEPGDVLYLPRGFIHSAAAQEGVSLHVTIGVQVTTVHDLLARIVDGTADVPALRRPLPPRHATDPQVAAQAVKDAIGALQEWLQDQDPGELGAELVDRLSARRRAPLDGQLLDLARLDQISDGTRVVRRTAWSLPVRIEGDRCELHLGDRRISLPARVEEPVRHLLDGEAHDVAELEPWLGQASRLVLVRRLVREGALRTVDGP